MKYILLCLLLVTNTLFASEKLTHGNCPKDQKCNDCTLLEIYGYSITLKPPFKKITLNNGLGLEVTRNKNEFVLFGTPHQSILPSIKEKLNVRNWIEYHELLANKSNDKKIELIRQSLDADKAKKYTRYENKKYTIFYVEQSPPIFSAITIIPKSNKQVLLINGIFSNTDAELMICNL